MLPVAPAPGYEARLSGTNASDFRLRRSVGQIANLARDRIRPRKPWNLRRSCPTARPNRRTRLDDREALE